jgi:hypothetical protein
MPSGTYYRFKLLGDRGSGSPIHASTDVENGPVPTELKFASPSPVTKEGRKAASETEPYRSEDEKRATWRAANPNASTGRRRSERSAALERMQGAGEELSVHEEQMRKVGRLDKAIADMGKGIEVGRPAEVIAAEKAAKPATVTKRSGSTGGSRGSTGGSRGSRGSTGGSRGSTGGSRGSGKKPSVEPIGPDYVESPKTPPASPPSRGGRRDARLHTLEGDPAYDAATAADMRANYYERRGKVPGYAEKAAELRRKAEALRRKAAQRAATRIK